MKATKEQIAEWQEKYGKGNIAELSADGKFCYVVDPTNSLPRMKLMIAARRKSVGHLVDSMMANCWIDGDESFKTDEALKQGIEDQVDSIMDLPDHEIVDLDNGNISIEVNDFKIEVRRATRQDLRYAEDRDKEGKPLVEKIFLLERIAVDKQALDALRLKVKEYVSVLLSLSLIKDKKHVDLKKF